MSPLQGPGLRTDRRLGVGPQNSALWPAMAVTAGFVLLFALVGLKTFAGQEKA